LTLGHTAIRGSALIAVRVPYDVALSSSLVAHQRKMPLWSKKHKKDSKEKVEVDSNDPALLVFRSDTLGIEPIKIPSALPPVSEKAGRDTPSPSPVSPSKTSRLSRLGIHHRSGSQNSLPNWTPPDESDPNAERDWEARATKLAKLRPMSMQSSQHDLADLAKLSVKDTPVTNVGRSSPDSQGSGWSSMNTVDGMTSDDALQEAIRLHEAGGSSIDSIDDRLGQGDRVVQENR
jgi:hypothetical protein